MVFPLIGGKKWRSSEHAHASYPGLFFRPPGFSPYMGGKKGEFGTGLSIALRIPTMHDFPRHYMRANERVHVENVRDFSQAKFESEINVFFS